MYDTVSVGVTVARTHSMTRASFTPGRPLAMATTSNPHSAITMNRCLETWGNGLWRA